MFINMFNTTTQIITGITDFIFDLFLIKLVMDAFLKERNPNISKFFYWLSFLVSEIVILINSYFQAGELTPLRTFINFCFSIGQFSLLSLLYMGSPKKRIFTSISCLLFFILGESISNIAFISSPITYSSNSYATETILTLIGKCISFLLILLTVITIHKKKLQTDNTYNLAILVTPIISMFIFATFVISSYPEKNFAPLLLSCSALLILNILNYYLLYRTSQLNDLLRKEEMMKQQLHLQNEKYNQLSLSYKNTRSIVHDTRKHLHIIRNAIENRQEKEALLVLNTLLGDLDNNYNIINYGNLVIDSFINLYTQMAKKNNLAFTYHIDIKNYPIPLRDYDFSIILGNLLDNSFNACTNLPPHLEQYIVLNIAFVENEFVIHMQNPYDSTAHNKNTTSSILEHGYGIQNIIRIAEQYKGFYQSFQKNDKYETIVVIPKIKSNNNYES